MNAPLSPQLFRRVSIDGGDDDKAADDRVSRALEVYATSMERGEPLSREELLVNYADVAGELAGCLDSLDFIRQVAPQLQDAGSSGTKNSDGAIRPLAVLGDFRIVREIGRGGMGVVYEAEQLSLGRKVALKVLPFATMLDKQQLKRFKNEARAAATLDHANIVAIYSVGEERGVHYYAMQLIEGESLAQVIARLLADRDSKNPPAPSPLRGGMGRGEEAGTRSVLTPPRPADQTTALRSGDVESPVLGCSRPREGEGHRKDAPDTIPVAALSTIHAPHSSLLTSTSREYFRAVARLGIQAAEALDHAHQQGVIHRDVKPGNLLVDDAGKLWVTDFGLARVEADAGMTMTGDLIGTLRYMSPEQALANRVVIDHRSDIYSLGVTLYELLTLQPAYAAEGRQELLRQIAFEEPRKPRHINARIPQDLETIVLKTIEKNPSQRYATAAELAAELRRHLANEPIKAKPLGWRSRAAKWARRHPAGVRATIAATLATTAVLAGTIGWAVRDRTARQTLLEEQVSLALKDAESSYVAGRLTDAMSAVKRADGFLAAGKGGDEIKRIVDQWRTDIRSAKRLEQIRIDRGAQTGGRSDTSFVDGAYLEVFRQEDIDLRSLTIEESAQRIRNSRIKDVLVAALHDWFQTGSDDHQSERSSDDILSRSHLLEIARRADPDSWRNRLRDAVEQSNEAAFLKLAGDEEALAQSTATITLLTGALTAQNAIDLLKQVQRQRPNDFWINIALANALRTIHPQRTEEAIAYRTAAVALRPDSAFALTHLGVALDSAGRFEEARAAFERAIRLNPKDMITRANLVGNYMERGKRADAEALLREMQRLQPADNREYLALGRALFAFGRTSEAATAFREAIRRKPTNWQAHLFLSGVLSSQGKMADAEAAAREAVRLAPSDLPSRWLLIELLISQGKREDAEAELAETIRIELRDHREYYALALVLVRMERIEEAERALREVIRLAPDSVVGHQQLSVVLLRQKKYAESAAAQRDALRIAPENVEILNSLSWLLATASNDDVRNGQEAVELATRACELTDYKSAGIVDTLAVAHAEAGVFDAAIRWATKALELADSDEVRNEVTTHLEYFRAGKPWHE